MTKVVWLPNETDYSYYEFVVPNTPYSGEFCIHGTGILTIHTV